MPMNWKTVAIEDLKKYRQLQIAADNLTSEIRALKDELDGMKSSGGTSPVKGGGSHYEDRIINNIVKRDRLRMNLKVVRHQLTAIERGINGITVDEYTILSVFYIDPPSKPVDLLKEKLFLEQSRIYQLKNTALYKFTVAMYGIVDL